MVQDAWSAYVYQYLTVTYPSKSKEKELLSGAPQLGTAYSEWARFHIIRYVASDLGLNLGEPSHWVSRSWSGCQDPVTVKLSDIVLWTRTVTPHHFLNRKNFLMSVSDQLRPRIQARSDSVGEVGLSGDESRFLKLCKAFDAPVSTVLARTPEERSDDYSDSVAIFDRLCIRLRSSM